MTYNFLREWSENLVTFYTQRIEQNTYCFLPVYLDYTSIVYTWNMRKLISQIKYYILKTDTVRYTLWNDCLGVFWEWNLSPVYGRFMYYALSCRLILFFKLISQFSICSTIDGRFQLLVLISTLCDKQIAFKM